MNTIADGRSGQHSIAKTGLQPSPTIVRRCGGPVNGPTTHSLFPFMPAVLKKYFANRRYVKDDLDVIGIDTAALARTHNDSQTEE